MSKNVKQKNVETGNGKRVTLWLKDNTLDVIDSLANDYGISRNAMICILVKDSINRRNIPVK